MESPNLINKNIWKTSAFCAVVPKQTFLEIAHDQLLLKETYVEEAQKDDVSKGDIFK